MYLINKDLRDIAIYDFCQTIVDFETGDEFVHYIMRQTKDKRIFAKESVRLFLNKTKILNCLERMGRNPSNCCLNKSMVLKQIKGYTKEQIEQFAKLYYEDVIKKHFIPPIIEQIQRQKEEGYIIVIVSASYEPFLKIFQEEYQIDLVITNQFKYTEDGYFEGEITRPDCIGENKVKRLKEEIPGFNREDYKECLAYGDSYSDRFILNIAKKGFVVSYRQSKKWVKDTKYEEIIYG